MQSTASVSALPAVTIAPSLERCEQAHYQPGQSTANVLPLLSMSRRYACARTCPASSLTFPLICHFNFKPFPLLITFFPILGLLTTRSLSVSPNPFIQFTRLLSLHCRVARCQTHRLCHTLSRPTLHCWYVAGLGGVTALPLVHSSLAPSLVLIPSLCRSYSSRGTNSLPTTTRNHDFSCCSIHPARQAGSGPRFHHIGCPPDPPIPLWSLAGRDRPACPRSPSFRPL